MNAVVVDCDFRYFTSRSSRRPPYDVLYGYKIVEGKIIFNKHGGPPRNRARPPPREILSSLPETNEPTFFLDDIPDYVKYSGEEGSLKMTRRACGSNLTQEKNPHLQVDDRFSVDN